MIRLTANNFLKFLVIIFIITPLYPQITGDVRIGIVHSGLTKQLLHKNDNNFYPIQDWELFFLNRKISYEVFEDDDLNDYSFAVVDVLILPSIEVLSDDGIESINAFLAEGKSLLVLGSLGTFDESSRIRKTDALNLMTGIYITELPFENNSACYQNIYADNFVGLGVEGTSKIQILNQLIPFYAKVVPESAEILGEYFSQAREEKEGNLPSIILYERKGEGSILWFGFQLSQISLPTVDRGKILEKIFLNSLIVLANKPAVWINSYPSDYSSAALLECNFTVRNELSSWYLTTLKDLEVRANFFIKPSQVFNSFEQLNSLAVVGDLNLLFDEFEFLEKDQFTIDSTFEQSYKFLSGESRQTGGFGIKFLNTYDVEKYLNRETEKYFDYYLTEDGSYKRITGNELEKDIGSYLPSEKIMINLTELMKKDYGVRSILQQDLELAKRTGEVIILTFDTDTLDKLDEKNKTNFRKVLNIIKESNCWVTTYSKLLDWHEKRKNLKVEIINDNEESLFTIQLNNSGDSDIENAGIIFSIPAFYKNITLKSYDYKLNSNKETGLYSIVVPFVKQGDKVLIDFEFERR